MLQASRDYRTEEGRGARGARVCDSRSVSCLFSLPRLLYLVRVSPNGALFALSASAPSPPPPPSLLLIASRFTPPPLDRSPRPARTTASPSLPTPTPRTTPPSPTPSPSTSSSAAAATATAAAAAGPKRWAQPPSGPSHPSHPRPIPASRPLPRRGGAWRVSSSAPKSSCCFSTGRRPPAPRTAPVGRPRPKEARGPRPGGPRCHLSSSSSSSRGGGSPQRAATALLRRPPPGELPPPPPPPLGGMRGWGAGSLRSWCSSGRGWTHRGAWSSSGGAIGRRPPPSCLAT